MSPGAGAHASPVGQHQDPTGGSSGTGFDPYLGPLSIDDKRLRLSGPWMPHHLFFSPFETEYFYVSLAVLELTL